ncbi:uncharacterized protein EDB93DRAFT_1256762 [Suillus bovinus]|uniref:uncharacterized protein n=1 Tax=Suillus bovinus TaxID=48563 RepID=UPI001B8620CF|nr:uncharacterized protein EDB93DRAFT_1256762 [Suillus bovinus]KAG2128311.1 hypothetical protein EDB93DRAFT_1256762 [Suillus bovinus]
MELVSQFTEDAVTQEDQDCDRPACRQPGFFVCGPCYVGYWQKVSSSVRPSVQRVLPVPVTQSMQRPQALDMSRVLPDPQIIRQSVNDAQRKSTINPPPVVPFSSGIGVSQTLAQGPDILVPSSWQHSQSLGQHRVASGGIGTGGYSAYHAQYSSECERWAKLLYTPPLAETITLEVSAVHEGNSQRKAGRGINIGNICEGKKDINAWIDAPGLIALVLDMVVPKLFMRDAAWVDLSTHQPNVPYFFSQCLVPSHRGQKAPTFKSKQFTLAVIVPAAQWNEYENWIEKIEEHQLHQSMAAQDLPPTASTTYDFEYADDGNATDGNTIGDSEDGNGVEDAIEDSEDATGIEDSEQGDDLESTRAPSLSAKRMHVRSVSDSHSSTMSPPRKKAAPLVYKGSDGLRLPSRDYLRVALKYGGSTNPDASSKVFDRHHEDVQYYPIPTRSLTDILKMPKYHTFELNISDSHIGQLTIDVPLHSMIGISAFKTAHPGWLTLSLIIPSGLGSRSQHPVVIKRPFFRPPSDSGRRRHCHTQDHVMYWAKSLLDYTYNYIDHHIGISPTPPPFEIPRVRFVDAGVALGYSQHNASSKPGDKSNTKAGAVSAVFLLEESILFDNEEEFTKFIHNMDCV